MIYDGTKDYSSYLEHYGVRGMKWGVRKKIELLGDRFGRRQETNTSSRKSYTPSRASRRRMRRLKTAGAIIGGVAGLYALGKLSGAKNPQILSTMNRAAVKAGKAALPKLGSLAWKATKSSAPVVFKASVKVGKKSVTQLSKAGINTAKKAGMGLATVGAKHMKMYGKQAVVSLIKTSSVKVNVNNVSTKDVNLGKRFVTDLVIDTRKDITRNRAINKTIRKEEAYEQWHMW